MEINRIISSAMLEAGIIAAGEEVESHDLVWGREKLGWMLGEWSNDPDISMGKSERKFNINGSRQVYTLGKGGDFDTEAPSRVVSVVYRSRQTDYSVKMIGSSDYANISSKNLVSGIPYRVWIDRSYPLRLVRFYPIPSEGEIIFHISTPFPSVEDGEKDLNLDRAYISAIVKNLAVELCPSYEKEPSPRLVMQASKALTRIENVNSDVDSIMITDDGVGEGGTGGYDWETGD